MTPFRPAPETEDKAPALSATLLAELEAHRTAGLQAALAGQPELALRVMLHALATDAFYRRYGETVLALHTYPPALAAACPGIADSPARQALDAAEGEWSSSLPREHGALWAQSPHRPKNGQLAERIGSLLQNSVAADSS